MKEFQVIIYAYGYRTKFKFKCEDSAEAIERYSFGVSDPRGIFGVEGA